MHSILKEIQSLRDNQPLSIDHRNTNRYRVVVFEKDGTKTAYCFGVPIYNNETRRLVDLQFYQNQSGFRATGSNAKITVSDTLTLQNNEGTCHISLPGKCLHFDKKQLAFQNLSICATTNGVLFRATCPKEGYCFLLSTNRPFLNVRANNKAFSLMENDFQPFVTVSCIGTVSNGGQVIAPANITYEKLTESDYQLSIFPTSPQSIEVEYEINLHEQKLFQDTTVESDNPKVNNAFGCTAFIGNTPSYGEQWLYSRLDTSRISQLLDHPINKAVLHFPMHDIGEVPLSAYRVSARFCSFGSNWSNKIAESTLLANTTVQGNYQHLDITNLTVDLNTRYLTNSDGLILKTKVKGSGFSAIATGDSYYAPQILEVNFR